MYIIFAVALAASLAIIAGKRTAGITLSLASILTLGGLLFHHMTDKLPISL